jgi:nucleotide-binding universal stress UspA family protein
MEKYKPKILVLSDLNESTSTILKSTISLAKMINGSIDFLCVKKPSEIVKKENQLSAIRNINQEHFAIKKEIANLITPINKDYNIKINHNLSFGNVKDEIGNYIKEHKPDLIVIGKRKSKILNLIGDNITSFVLKNHKGVIMISANDNSLEPEKKLVLGLLNNMEDDFEFSKNLIEHTQKPVKSFKLVKASKGLKETSHVNNKDYVEYVFEDNDNSMDNLSNYLSKNNINLLCVNRDKNLKNKFVMKDGIVNLIGKLNVSMLLTTSKNSVKKLI